MTKDKDVKSLDQIKGEADPDIEIHALRRQVEGLKNEIKTMQADYGDLAGYFRDIGVVANELKIPPQPLIYQKKDLKSKVASECVAVVHWTDWHYGAIQDPDEVEGFNSFSPEILEARIKNFNQDFLKWVNVLREGYNINNCVVIQTADNISGDIHKELSVTNAFPTPVQAFKCGVFMGEALSMLSPYFSNVTMEFITPDNHGRLTKRPQSNQAGMNTHNYVVGHVSKLITENIENVNVNVHLSHTKVVEVLTRKYLITHGHDVKGWAGFPYYGIERKVSREALNRLWEPDYNKFHRVVMGHWHAPLTHPWYWIGGSASGTSAYDHQQGRRSDPIQCCWLVHPKKGEFNRTEFKLRD